MESFGITAPCSASNLGPGFDTLGLALNLYNRFTVEPGGPGLKITIASRMKPAFRKNIELMIRLAIDVFLAKTGVAKPSARIVIESEIPLARGLGSSGAYRLGTLAAMNRLCGDPLGMDSLIDLCCGIEKHTENSVSSAVGGLTASGFIGDTVVYARYPVHEKFSFVAAIPDFAVGTPEMRKLLPKKVPLRDAVANMNRATLLIDALSAGKCSLLPRLFEDKLHQPYRVAVMTPLYDVIDKAMAAGACGGFLSGSGSTIMAVTTGEPEAVGIAMRRALTDAGWPSRTAVLKPDHGGLIIS